MRLSRFVMMALMFAAPLGVAGTFTDQKRGFSFELPEGFVAQSGPMMQHRFLREDPVSGAANTLIIALTEQPFPQGQDFDRALVEATARRGAIKAGTQDLEFQYDKVSWRGFELMVVGTRSVSENNIGYSVRVPVMPGAVQVMINGPLEDEKRLRAQLDAVVTSLKGETNWETEEERNARLAKWAGLGAGGLLIVGVVVVLIRRRSARAA